MEGELAQEASVASSEESAGALPWLGDQQALEEALQEAAGGQPSARARARGAAAMRGGEGGRRWLQEYAQQHAEALLVDVFRAYDQVEAPTPLLTPAVAAGAGGKAAAGATAFARGRAAGERAELGC